ncbi:MAG: DUF882 domain-containing protein [Acidobacteria bacterium]|nr:DUF882 domain-containing protein [Acidobacteriota bacterium]
MTHESLAPARRDFLRKSLGFAALLVLPRPLLALTEPVRTLGFVNTHTREELDVTYWDGSGYAPSALDRINHILRDHRSGEARQIEVRLLDLLHSLRASLGIREAFHVISGYRSPATNAMLHERGRGVAQKSLHLQGRAIDIRVPGVKLEDLRQAALELGQGGVGFYRASDFIHVDTGRVRRW